MLPLDVTTAEANRLLKRLRPLLGSCSGLGRRFVDSLMLSCYLQGLLDADSKLRGEAA